MIFFKILGNCIYPNKTNFYPISKYNQPLYKLLNSDFKYAELKSQHQELQEYLDTLLTTILERDPRFDLIRFGVRFSLYHPITPKVALATLVNLLDR